jgi:hypothetical protein
MKPRKLGIFIETTSDQSLAYFRRLRGRTLCANSPLFFLSFEVEQIQVNVIQKAEKSKSKK